MKMNLHYNQACGWLRSGEGGLDQSDGNSAVRQEAVVERLQIEAASQTLLLALAQIENLVLAHEIRHWLCCRLSIASDFPNGIRAFEVRDVHQHVNGFIKRHLRSVQFDVDNHTARTPQLAFQLKNAV